MKEIVLIGGGGHCKSVIDVIEQESIFKIIGILDKPELLGTNVLGYTVIGNDLDMKKLASIHTYALITVGQLQSSEIRKKLFDLAMNAGFTLPSVISPRAYVSKHAYIGNGSIVMHNALVNADTKIGCNCIINTNALVEHDSDIDNHCHIATSTIINGGTSIGQGSFVGSGSISKQGANIGANSFIKAGSVVK